MTAVEVDRLNLRCEVDRREPLRFALEDALRTELPDDGRLVLLRRLQIAADGTSAHAARRQAAMRDAWAAATGGARHGGDDGAADANCVWFASRAEAERLLLDRLLRGRSAMGWFWKLALPHWRDQPVREWLPDLVVQAIAAGEEHRLLTLVEVCIDAHAADMLATALECAASPAMARATAGKPPPELRPAWSGAPAVPLHAASRRIAMQTVASLAPSTRAVLRRLAPMPRANGSLRTVLKALLVRASPALSLAPPMLERAVEEAFTLLVAGPAAAPRATPDPGEQVPSRRIVPTPVDFASVSSVGQPAEEANGSLPVVQRHGVVPDPAAPAPPPVRDPAPTAKPPPLGLPHHSRHAGLWLVLPALGDMGLRGWLARHPELLGGHPGRQLMLAIARHHRVPAGDPALACFGRDEIRAPAPDWARQWRHGLDRWLRRHARRRLHDLVNRSGGIRHGEQRLDVVYPLADADIRLRRLALDRDPGWTDWLGLSIRYRFGAQDDP